tara:strand:- start:432 stop:1376 length:945 start_codon:yes stop_codon:yes gene_type:complete
MLSIISIDAIIEYIVGSHWLFDKTTYSENHNNRISGLFDEEYIIGGFILAFFPSTLLLINDHLKSDKRNKIFFIIILFIVFTTLVVISGERASLAKMVLLFIFIIFFTRIFGKLRGKLIAIILMISFISVFIISQPKLNERLIYHTVDLILQNKDQKKIDRNLSIYEYFKSVDLKNLNFAYYSDEHRDHAIISINMFKDKFIFGHGVKMFRFSCSKNEYFINNRACSTHSHGIFFSFISELGIIGLIFLIIIYYYLIKRIIKTNETTEKVILLTILIYLFPFVPSGYFFNNFFSLVLYFLVGIYLGKKKINLHN